MRPSLLLEREAREVPDWLSGTPLWKGRKDSGFVAIHWRDPHVTSPSPGFVLRPRFVRISSVFGRTGDLLLSTSPDKCVSTRLFVNPTLSENTKGEVRTRFTFELKYLVRTPRLRSAGSRTTLYPAKPSGDPPAKRKRRQSEDGGLRE
jgi:hypothetical protein